MKKFFLVAPALLTLSCGTEVKPLGRETQVQKPPPKCSVFTYETFHEVMIHLTSNAPNKIAIEIDGVEELNECKPAVPPQNDPPPLVSAERFEGFRLAVIVQHLGAYRDLPRETTVKLTNMKNCVLPPEVVIDTAKVELNFVTDYPRGPGCPSRTLARAQPIKQSRD